MSNLPSNHLLSLGRPDVLLGPPTGAPDTTTLAAHDFDVDNRTGFMPPQPPVSRLPEEWDAWENTLGGAIDRKVQLGGKLDITDEEVKVAEEWRECVRQMPILPIGELIKSEVLLRRAHQVLAWILHFYVNSHPSTSRTRITIPPPLTLPLLQVCHQLQLPPVITYSDVVVYNWALIDPSKPWSQSGIPDLYNLRSMITFSSTPDEEEFYLTSARMEFRGVEALGLMRDTMDELFVGDEIAVKRITDYLIRIARVERDLKDLLLNIREGCQPEVFYNQVRPWLTGGSVTSDPTKLEYDDGEWVWEGIERDPGLKRPTELAGSSAGQSSLIHSLDIFLGVGSTMGEHPNRGLTANTEDKRNAGALLKKMQRYMPRHHRNFLQHLEANQTPLRVLVESKRKEVEDAREDADKDPDAVALVSAYNEAVVALKELRDAHMVIVTIYILGPARRLAQEMKRREEEKEQRERGKGEEEARSATGESTLSGVLKSFTGLFGLKGEQTPAEPTPATATATEVDESAFEHPPQEGADGKRNVVHGTGGTDVVEFLKGVRDLTAQAVIKSSE